MNCLAILTSGNYVFNLHRILERKGLVFEVVSTPCQIAKDGCGYCLKFPEQHKDTVVAEGIENRLPVREIYRIVPMFSKNKYERVY
ncbi:MAG: DUF3343 domain-containing protein [Clostridia bacterium]|nr:DUF3343 domain-containing protein [Clostridia bacterium]